ncbi:hypothetical protein C6361_22685 [Plantactinospora sp. BC1]|nr:hypothetical protein C6361_22685 [Plantactinospora sp. BC1]
MHVLSTPPAFVLSQDQTLQQKPSKNLQPGNNKNTCCQTNKPFGTGLSSTLLSSQRTTTHQTTSHKDQPPGAIRTRRFRQALVIR